VHNVLVVEDDVQVRTMLRMILEDAGYRVREASDGYQAIGLHRSCPADLVVTDILMPEKEGFETIMELRTEWPELQIIAITGGGSNDPQSYLELAKKIGAARAFRKPVDQETLLAAVRELVETD
jgi:DNA-binding response OmpR family regulator